MALPTELTKVIQCEGEARKAPRRTWYASVLRLVYAAATDIGGSQRWYLALAAGGGLFDAGDTGAAFGFAAGFLCRWTLLRFYD